MILTVLCFATLTMSSSSLSEILDNYQYGNQLFSEKLYKEISKNLDANFLVSPFSARSILALLYAGTQYSTADEIQKNCFLPNRHETTIAVKHLNAVLNDNTQYVLQTANKVYVKPKFSISPSFKKVAIEFFGAGIEAVDFEKSVEAAGTINKWVEEQTNYKIRNLVDASKLNEFTRSVLVNSLYLKGNWSSPFQKFHTHERMFHQSSTKAVAVDMMLQTSQYKYFEDHDVKIVEIPFKGQDLTLTVILPKEKFGIHEIEKTFNGIFTKPNYSDENVKIFLPKFKMETSLELKEILQKLGIRKIFDEDEGDLSGIAGKKGDLIVDTIIQKTFIDVGEEGVEAAAATYAVVVAVQSAFLPRPQPKEFIADHPFIFYIKFKDLVLFAGKVLQPNQN